MKNKHKNEDIAELGVFSIRINSDKINKQLLSLLYKYRHFENMLLILIKVNYNLYIQGKDTNDFKYLSVTKYVFIGKILKVICVFALNIEVIILFNEN